MGKDTVDKFFEEIGTLKDISEKFHKVYPIFLTLIGPLCALNDWHKKAQQEGARGAADYREEALNELNMSINAFSRYHGGIGSDLQLYVNHIKSPLKEMIASMSMLNKYAADSETSADDAILFEMAKKTYQESIVASKNLHELLSFYNESVRREVFDLKDWPTEYFP